jgi:hypothetical protein
VRRRHGVFIFAHGLGTDDPCGRQPRGVTRTPCSASWWSTPLEHGDYDKTDRQRCTDNGRPIGWQRAPSPAQDSTMSNATSAALAEPWKDLWNGDLAHTDKIFAEDFVAHATPLTGSGADQIRGRAAGPCESLGAGLQSTGRMRTSEGDMPSRVLPRNARRALLRATHSQSALQLQTSS